MITRLTFKIYATPQNHEIPPQPMFAFGPDPLFRAVKQQLDPDGLFRPPVFGEEI